MNGRIAMSTNARLLLSTLNVVLLLSGSTMNSELVLLTMTVCLMLSTKNTRLVLPTVNARAPFVVAFALSYLATETAFGCFHWQTCIIHARGTTCISGLSKH